MAIDDISEYVNRQIIRLVSAQRQKQKQNDFGRYADKVNDWRRKKLFSELSSKENLDDAEILAWQYKEALDSWKDIAHLLLTIRNSSFYQQINRHKRISRNVYLTNILKNECHSWKFSFMSLQTAFQWQCVIVFVFYENELYVYFVSIVIVLWR